MTTYIAIKTMRTWTPKCRQHRSFVSGAAVGFDPQTRYFARKPGMNSVMTRRRCLNRRNDRGIGLRVHDRRLPIIDPL